MRSLLPVLLSSSFKRHHPEAVIALTLFIGLSSVPVQAALNRSGNPNPAPAVSGGPVPAGKRGVFPADPRFGKSPSPLGMQTPVAQRAEAVPGEVLVKFRHRLSANEVPSLHAEVGAEVLSTLPGIQVQRVRGMRGQTTEELIEAYKGKADVQYVEPNIIVHAQLTPNDPKFSSLWGLNNTGQLITRPDGSSFSGTPGADIHLPAAWNLKTGSGSVIVADIDTGVDYNHPDLAGNIWTNSGEIAGNGIDDDGNGFVDDFHGWNFVNNTNDPMDDYGHGTHTAGTIGAVGNNGVGVVGVNWTAKVMPIKFMDSGGSGTIENAARAILYASQMGAKISNNSWGCTGVGCFSQTFEDALKVAYGRGMLFVVAAGNTSASLSGLANNNDMTPTYPCNSTQPNVLCVAATEDHDAKAFFSNYGNVSVDLGAPGEDILSTVPTGNCSLCDPSGYMFLSGTSMATPHVSGAAALALAQYPTLTTGQLKNLLIGSTDPVPALKGLTATGGRLNVNNALRSNFIIGSPDSAAASAGQTTDFTISIQSLNGFSGPITLSFAASDSNITGSFSVNSVTPPANGSAGTTLTVSTASGMAAGSYVLTVSGSAINSSGQAEAHLGTMTLSVQTDLALTALSGPALGESGKWFTMTETVQNLGTGLAKGFYIGYYLSADSAITPSDIRIGSRWIPALSPGASSSAGADVWIPAGLPSGTYYLGALIDDLSEVPDSNAANNTLPGKQISVNSGAPASPIWTDRYNDLNNGSDLASKIVVDAAANSYVTGSTCRIVQTPGNSCSGWDITTIKYDPNGNRLWVATYNNDASDYAVTLAIDASGNTYLGGLSCLTLDASGLCSVGDYLVVKYDPHGNLLWAARYGNGSWNSLYDLKLDASGNVYVTGTSCDLNCSNWSDATVKFDANGNQLWVARNSFGNFSHGIVLALDAAGNTYVSGDGSPTGFMSYVTVKYDPKGSLIWTAQYNNDGWYTSARAIALDTIGNVYVSGASQNGTDFDVATVKYNSTGQQLWARRYDNGGDDLLGFWNGIYGQIAVDDSGNVYIAGVSSNGLDDDYVTIKYDTNGNFLWSARYNGGREDIAQAQAIDRSGNVYVTGFSCNNYIISCFGSWERPDLTFRYITIKYGSDGHPLWNAQYNSGLNDSGTTIAVDRSGNIYVSGLSTGCQSIDPAGFCENSSGFDYATVKYGAPLPDLVLTAVSGPSTGAAGQSILLSDSVKNQGTEPAGSFSVGYYLSADATITTADLFLGSRSVDGLAAGSSNSATASIAVPSNLSPGIYYLGAIADYDNRISETNDTNNGLAGNRITITASSNLLFSDDFNRTTGLGPNWQVYFGSFITDGNSAVSQGSIASWAAVTPNLNTNDYSVEATLTVPSGSLYSGIAARGNPANSFYKDLYAAQIATDGHVNLYRRNAGNWTLLKSAPASIAAGTAYTLKLTVSGGNPVNLQVSLNGAVLFNFQDASASRILSGIPGIGNYNPGVSYDRFTVSAIASSAPPPLQSIAVTPTNPTIAIGAAQPFTATGHFSDGSTKDLTASVAWSSGNTAVAATSNQAGSQGVAKGISAGSATISAVDPATSISGSTILTVTAGNQAPIARLSANPTSGVAPLLVHFDGSGSSDPDGTIASYAWSFGDGAGGTGATADHTYAAAGTYTATLTVTDNQGAKGSAQTTVTVSTPSSSILVNDDFNRTTGLGSNWQVFFGGFTTDGSSAVSQGSIANWAAITSTLNTNDYTVESVLTIPAGSVYSGIVARGNLSTGFYQDLYAAQIATNGSVNLYRRNGGSWTQLKSAPAGIVAGTAYTLKLKVAGSSPVNLEVSLNGNSLFTYQDSSTSQIISGVPGIENYNPNVKYDRFTVSSNSTTSINKPPISKILTDTTSGLAPLTVHFDGSTSSDPDGSIASYLWNFGDGSSGTNSIISHTYNQAGTYTASLTVTDNNGATGTAQVTITVTAPGTTTLFSDDFNRTTGLGSNWQVYFGSFTTDGNNAVSQGTVANWAAITPSLNTNDYSVEAALIIPAGSLYSGIVARGNPGTGFLKDLYAAQIATDGTVNLYRRNAGTWTQLKSASAGIAAGTSYALKLKVSGTNPVSLEVSLNGSALFTFSDASASRILSGIPGVQNYNSGVTYDRFTVTSPQK